MDTSFYLEALRKYREDTGDRRNVDSLPATVQSRILLEAQKLKDLADKNKRKDR